MSTFTESVVEDAALAWLADLGYTVLHGPDIALDGKSAERTDPLFRDTVLQGRLRDALTRLNPSLPPDAIEDAARKLLRTNAYSGQSGHLIRFNSARHSGSIRPPIPAHFGQGVEGGAVVRVWRGIGERNYGVGTSVAAFAPSKALVDFTNSGSTGTRMPRTSWSELARYPIVIPDGRTMAEFSKTARALVERIGNSIHEFRALTTLRDTLLPKLISGELRLADVNGILSRATA